MTGIRGPDYELAEKNYMAGMKYKDIATKYNVSINTVKSWKQRYKWNRNGVHTDKKVCTQNKKSANIKKESITNEVKEVLENTELTDKQRLFCVIYSRCLNATKAYKKAYSCSYETAMVNGSNLLRNAKINEQIEKLNATQFNKEFIKQSLIQKYLDIAFSDMSNYVEFGRKEIETGKDEDNNPVMIEVNYVDFKDSSEVDGTLISEVSQGKNGVSIKLQDKMKAMQWLSDRVDWLSTETKLKLENEKTKIEMAQEKLDLEKLKVTGNDEEVEDDGFLEALKGTVSEVWDNE
ncbi:terminase small subunit [Clostridium algidicarnis]|uniref:terminase small subunit n=1 Tax=Clostridium algidicarnis TaxID=37659 RepID=UPI001FD0695F|nr:terminase small subunit [Clostridium algidicarnis]